MSMAIGQAVDISLTRQKEKDAEVNFTEDCNALVLTSELNSDFIIPNAAAKLSLTADVARKVISISMKIEAPKDRSRATSSINWMTKQLKKLCAPKEAKNS